MKIRHVGIVVINLNKSISFWKKYFNFKVIKNLNESGEVIDKMLGHKNCLINTIKMSNNKGSSIELINFIKPRIKKKNIHTNNNGITHIAMTVDNLSYFYNKHKKNIKFNCQPQVSKDGKVKVLYAKTPENCYIELVEEIK